MKLTEAVLLPHGTIDSAPHLLRDGAAW